MSSIKIDLEEIGVLDFLLEYLNDNLEVINSALHFDGVPKNERATVDQVKITEVVLGPEDQVEIHYEYDWSFYHGCKDIRGADKVVAVIKGKYSGGSFEFPDVEMLPERTTYEEF